jgi:class 3 adenylate cyclase/tetratricopeptide (TPR) repeat protein
MATSEEQLRRVRQIEAGISAQESLRATLGDAVVDTTVEALRAQLEALGSPAVGERQPLDAPVPTELAIKMRAGGRGRAERRRVTVLFADLSGYTALGERLDPEDIAELSNDFLRVFADCVYQHEGYVEKFAGDAITALFGAPIAHEDDPERALRAALAMRERLEEVSRRWESRIGEALALHVGINTGTVVAGDVGHDLQLQYTVMGDTINTAQRLLSVAAPGQILVSRDTYRMTHTAFTFEVLGQVVVKGKRDPLTMFELKRAKLRPTKARGLLDLGQVFVGREDELATLRSVAGRLRAGSGSLVTLVAEAGVGKSRLMAEWRRALGEGVHWIEGRAYPHTTTLAYGPFLDVRRGYAGISDEEAEARARRRLRETVDRFFPRDAEAQAIFANLLAMRLSVAEAALLEKIPAEARRRRFFALAADLFTRLAADRPTVLVVEDMHWADTASVDLLEHLLASAPSVRLVIVGVSRDEADSPIGRLRAAAGDLGAGFAVEIPLAPLSEAASLAMVEQMLETTELPPALRETVLAKAEGNPFYVEELVRALIERGALMRAESGRGWTATSLIDSVSVPDTLEGLLLSRIDRLPDDTRDVVQQAAVIGRIFLYRVLARIAEDTPLLDADLSDLERRDLIRERAREPEVEYTFKHALTQEVAYQSLLGTRRRELHRRIGHAMEELFADRIGELLTVVGSHFLRGESWGDAGRYLLQAGDAAAGLYAATEARAHYASALSAFSHLPDSPDNLRHRVDATVALCRESIFVDPQANLERLSAIEPAAEALAASEGQVADRVRLAWVHHELGRSLFTVNKPIEAIGYYQRVLAAVHHLGDTQLLAVPSFAMGQVVLYQGFFSQAEPLLFQALPGLERSGDVRLWIDAIGSHAVTLAARGRYRDGLAQAERGLERAVELNSPQARIQANVFLATVHNLGGEFQAASDATRTALEIGEQLGDQLLMCIASVYNAYAESMLGHHEAARASMERARAIGSPILADQSAEVGAVLALNEGNLPGAIATAQEAVSIAQQTGSTVVQAYARRVWGQALAHDPAQWDEATEQLALAVQLWEGGGCIVEAARTHLIWGQLARARGDAVAAEQLHRAVELFAATDLGAEHARARAELG